MFNGGAFESWKIKKILEIIVARVVHAAEIFICGFF